jgi:colicin import membrane protein
MKAALSTWGAGSNLFHQGMAREADDPAIIQATLKKPGVVLKRAVGSTDPFTEHPKLSMRLPGGDHGGTQGNRSHRKEAEAIRAATVLSERDEKWQLRDQQREKAAEQKREARRFKTVAKAEAALTRAEGDHKTKSYGARERG